MGTRDRLRSLDEWALTYGKHDGRGWWMMLVVGVICVAVSFLALFSSHISMAGAPLVIGPMCFFRAGEAHERRRRYRDGG